MLEVTSPADPRKGWLDRHWRWAVPVGCLGILLLVGAFVLAILTLVFSLIRSSEPYETAMERARSNTEVTEFLGTPVEEGYFTTGNINLNNDGGNANLRIPVSGPKGRGETIDLK